MKTTKADKWFSLFIRLRDTEDGVCRCITCGRAAHPKTMDCGHYIKRQHQATRFNEMNCAAQCKHCNAFEQGRDQVFRARLVERYGEENVLIMEAAGRREFKRAGFVLDELANIYKAKAKALSIEKGIELW